MTTTDDKARSAATRGLLSSLRDVLFEKTAEPATQLVRDTAGTALAPAATPMEIAAARSVLCTAIEAQLGPGIREFSLQNQALSEALPDVTVRQKAVLRVLSLKGIAREQLCSEVLHAISTLRAQGETFARKLHDRRSALVESQRLCSDECARETAQAELAISRIQTELDAQRAQITDSRARRDQRLAECETTAVELSARELGFQTAFREVEGEYAALEAQLSQETL